MAGRFVGISTSDALEVSANIKVLGVGGGGGNAVSRMVTAGVGGVEFVAVNTDVQALRSSLAQVKIQIGENIVRGLGVGGNPELGRRAAEEDIAKIEEVIDGADMIFVTAGMGGGTGTGAAPVIAKLARSKGILTVAVVTRPFEFELPIKQKLAEEGIRNLQGNVDTLVIIPNERLFVVADSKMPMEQAYRIVDDVLRQSIQAVTDIITHPGKINRDFNDVRSVLLEAGEAFIGIGESSGPNRVPEAVSRALHNPLLENVNLRGAKKILVNITADENITSGEIQEVMTRIIEALGNPEDTQLSYGHSEDKEAGDRLKVSIIASGITLEKSTGNWRPSEGGTAAVENISDVDILTPAINYWKKKYLK